MKVLVIGGDGFCGWPTSLHLSSIGHEVTILDNLSRREIDIELEVESLTPIRPIGERLRVWKEVSTNEIGFVRLDLAEEYDRLVEVLGDLQPDAVVHFGEQRAAPYSMRSSAARVTTGPISASGSSPSAMRRLRARSASAGISRSPTSPTSTATEIAMQRSPAEP